MSRSCILTRPQIEGLIASNQLIVIYENKVLRLDKWIGKHPGGKLPIMHMVGKDATDALQIYHSAEALQRMDYFRIGHIDGPWVDFEPPISGGVFRPYEEEEALEKPTSKIIDSDISTPSANDGARKAKVEVSSYYDHEISISSAQEKMKAHATISGALNKDPKNYTPVEFMAQAERLEIESDIQRYPSVHPDTQQSIVLKYRQLHQEIKDRGYYNCRYSEYAIECVRYFALFALFATTFKYEWYMTSAVFLGFFWQQIMFTAHDAGHMAITHNFVVDSLIGIFIADFCCGLSIGWWKSSHNVHHLVPNHPEHDPDIQNVPLFATSPRFFQSIRSTYYHNFVFVWDKAADICTRFQKYTYYPVMALARFNLFLLSWLHLISDRSCSLGSAAWTRPTEVLAMVGYWYWFGYVLVWKCIPTWPLRIGFVLMSAIITMLLHVQITLSHWGMSTSDLGPTESFAQKQLRTTMDVDCPAWFDFVHGGLQFQVVHHLFPRVPRHNLRRVQGLVKEFCKEVDIEYTIFGFVDGNKVILSRLGEISKQVELLSACHTDMAKTGDLGLH